MANRPLSATARSVSMECPMENQTHARLLSANQELRGYLRWVERMANGTGTVTEEELNKISLRLMNLAPQVGDASRSETLDAALQSEVAEYVRNLRALQGAIKNVRCVLLARRVQLEGKKRRTYGSRGWI